MATSFHLDKEIINFISQQKPDGLDFTGPQKLLQVHNGILYLWSHLHSNIVTYSLVNKEIVVLLLSSTPIFNVEHLQVSNTGRFLCLSGTEGVSLVELPSRLAKKGRFAKQEDEDVEIVCRAFPLSPKFFLVNPKILVQKVAFHPGSIYDSHVVVLTSDNCLRIFNVDDKHLKPERVITFSKDDSSESKTFGKSGLTLKAAIGETAVDFTFGSPATTEASGDGDSAIVQNLWPVFVLNGNGTVHCLLIGIETQCVPRVLGILPMYPDAEDNYGFESCSILCLHPTISSPPVLVIATNGGTLYHCIVFNEDSDDDEVDDKSVVSDWSSSAFGKIDSKDFDLSLYVSESIELELSLDTQSTDITSVPFDYSILLHPDPISPGRYFCSHKAGIHSVKVPIVSQIAEMALKDDGGAEFNDEQNSYVEHLVCTQMVRDIKPAPILGVAVAFPPSSLIFITSDFNAQCLELSLPYFMEPRPLGKSEEKSISSLPLHKSSDEEPFDKRIAQLLQKSTTLPMLKTMQGVETTNEANLKVLTKSLRILRTEYMARLERAKIEIERKRNQLDHMKGLQQSKISKLEQERINLRENATKISEQYEDIKDNLESLNTRVQRVIDYLQNQDPSNSDAQLIFERHIKNLQQKVKTMKNAFEQIRSKERFQFRQILQDRQNTSPLINPSSSPEKLTKDHLSSIKKMLEKDTLAISDVVQELNDAKKNLAMLP